ncbi:MAG: CHASE2 domain-containing protein, partial [Alphaproteobacteria bacterium]
FAFAGDDPRPFVPAYRGAVLNLPALEAAAEGNGSLNGLPERDGVIRRTPLVLRMGDELLPSLGAEALRVAQGERTFVIKASGASGVESFGESTGISRIKIGQFAVPTDENGRVWIYYSGFQPERFIPAWKIFEPDFDPALVEGRILFIGTSAAGLKDLRITPLDPAAAGVEIYVELLEQIFSGEYLSRPDFALGVEVVYLLGIGLVLIVLLPRVGARWCGALGVAAVGFAVGASWIAFDHWRWLFDPVYPSLVIIVVYVVETGLIFLRTESERRWVRGAFARYISPAVVNRLAEHPERLALGGEMRNMTILFCDIRDFTARSEKLDAHGVTRFINRYLTPMSEVVLAHQGTIDKYIGDCIMAFWNAPLDDPAHARNASRAATAMRAELARLNAIWAGEARAAGRLFDPVRVGIGLNTGMCCVGNMGSDQRFDYSVLGDDVNLASRLEGQSKIYGVDIVISETTRAEAPGEPALELDLIRVKGKTKPVRVFTLLGAAEAEALAAPHAAMLGAYRAGDWGAAEAALVHCRAAAPSSLASLYTLYAERISAYRAAPPPADWDGAYTATEK